MGPPAKARVHSAIMTAYRRATPKPRYPGDPWLTDFEVITQLGVMSPQAYVVRERAGLMARLIHLAPPRITLVVSAASHARHSWTKALQADLDWLGKSSPLCTSMLVAPDPAPLFRPDTLVYQRR